MEHFYVVSGNEFGIDIYSKKNFTDKVEATEHFEKTKTDDFGCYVRLRFCLLICMLIWII